VSQPAISYSIDWQKRIVSFVVEGTLTVDEAKSASLAVSDKLGTDQGIRILIDARYAHWRLDFAELEQVAFFTQQMNDVYVRKTAVVVSNNLSGDVAEIIVAYSDSGSSPMRIFEKVDDARAWLEGPPEED